MINNKQRQGFTPLENFRKNKGISLTGFTLIELLISISILLIVSGIVYTIFRNSLNYWTRGYASSRRQHSARLIFSRMTSNISSLFISKDKNIYCFGAKDKFYFIAFSTQNTESDLSEIGYDFDSADKTLSFSYQKKADYNFDTYDYKKAIAIGVISLSFSYLDEDGNWLSDWDSRQGGQQEGTPPQAVKIYFEVENIDFSEKKEVFETIVELPIRTKYM